jgi:hypothetical protein
MRAMYDLVVVGEELASTVSAWVNVSPPCLPPCSQHTGWKLTLLVDMLTGYMVQNNCVIYVNSNVHYGRARKLDCALLTQLQNPEHSFTNSWRQSICEEQRAVPRQSILSEGQWDGQQCKICQKSQSNNNLFLIIPKVTCFGANLMPSSDASRVLLLSTAAYGLNKLSHSQPFGITSLTSATLSQRLYGITSILFRFYTTNLNRNLRNCFSHEQNFLSTNYIEEFLPWLRLMPRHRTF